MSDFKDLLISWGTFLIPPFVCAFVFLLVVRVVAHVMGKRITK